MYLKSLVLFMLIWITATYSFAQEADPVLSTPDVVVRKFCQLDAEGVRLRGDTWKKSISPLVTWREEAGDMIEIIDQFIVGKTTLTDSLAVIPVEYKYIGSTDFMTFTAPIKRSITITFKLLRKNGKWKIDGPITAPHVNWKTAIAELRATQKREPERKGELEAVINKINKAAKN